MKQTLLKFIKRSLVVGLPFSRIGLLHKSTPRQFQDIVDSPNIFDVPATIGSSCYVNYCLDDRQVSILEDYIKVENDNFEIIPISVFEEDEMPRKMLTMNIYSVHNFVYDRLNSIDEKIGKHKGKLQKIEDIIHGLEGFGININTNILQDMKAKSQITMCDIKTYVRNKETGECGTMVLDYVSNIDFVDPINIYKKKQGVFHYEDSKKYTDVQVSSHIDKVDFSMHMNKTMYVGTKLCDDFSLIHGKRYYRNGVCDQIHLDESFTQATVCCPYKTIDNKMYYNDMTFDNYHSAFFFPSNVNMFVRFWHSI